MRRNYDLVCFDMDGTLTKVRSSWSWIHDCLGVDGSANYKAFINGEIDCDEYMRRDIKLWLDKKPKINVKDIIHYLQSIPLIDGIQETVAQLKSCGISCVIISGGLNYAADMLRNEFGFDNAVSDKLKINPDGTLTGEGISIVNLEDKGYCVKEYQKKYGVTKERTVSIGNSFTDIKMFESSGISIAFNAQDDYTKNAATYVIDSGNLSDVLEYIIPNDSE